MPRIMDKWLLVYSRPLEEVRARENLSSERFNVYLPMSYKDKKVTNKTNAEPMFPRYLFAYFEEGVHDLRKIKKCPGVAWIPRFGDRLAYLSGDIIESIREREDDLGLIDVWKDYNKGDPVRVKEGPLHDFSARFLKHGKRERVAIMLEESQKVVWLGKKDIVAA